MLQQSLTYEGDSVKIKNVLVPHYERGPLKTFVTASTELRNEPFIVCPADLISMSINFKKIIRSHLQDEALLSLAVDPRLEIGTRVHGDERGLVTGVGDGSEGRFLGSSAQILVAEHQFVRSCLELEKRGFTTLSEVIKELVSKGRKIRATPIANYWRDIDTFQELIDANRHILSSKLELPSECVSVPAGDTMEFGEDMTLSSGIKVHSGTRIIGPTLIMKETTIAENCIIGPNVSLSEGTTVGASSSIENAIVFGPGTAGEGMFLSNVIIFKDRIIQGETTE
ncbi:NDP-sugar synthase [Candidatus Thorarchaeota archaeon]|nr:MAG: NDP-sugar synthase [Candidatus Thorarchaeota archaeon]